MPELEIMRRVLFFCEAVTLAHVARLAALARTLDPSQFQLFIACPDRWRHFVGEGPWQFRSMFSIGSEQFLSALASGKPVYDLETLRGYLSEDLALIEEIRPDVVVGDFRLSLSVSARLARVPYITISNAYWSPCGKTQDYPLPVLPLTRLLPVPLAAALFSVAVPFAMRGHCKPMNQLRLENGMSTFGPDLRRVYTDADLTLFADFEVLFPDLTLLPHHRFLGPILWSPAVKLPSWWETLPDDSPIIYVTMGSSGRSGVLELVLAALADEPVLVIASTAGAPPPRTPPSNARIADYLPGDAVSSRSSLVICNGGSPTSHQALAAGVPVLGIASNMDQFLNMRAISAAGAGLVMRADRVTVNSIRSTCSELLTAKSFRTAALAVSKSPDAAASGVRFSGAIRALTPSKQVAPVFSASESAPADS